MLSLLLGFAQARAKHVSHKHTETQKTDSKVPESLAPFVSKDPRYIKVYYPKESATPAKNGGGVTKAYLEWPFIYVYLDDDKARALQYGCSVSAILAGIPEAIVTKVLAVITGISGVALANANRGRGVVIKILGQTPVGIWGQ